MKRLVTALVTITLIIATSACSSPGDPFMVNSDLIIINTYDPHYGMVLFHKDGEGLILATQNNENGSISNVASATWISSDKKSITVYLDNGLPNHAVVEGNLIIFQYDNDGTVNVKIIDPDGTISTKSNIPIDVKQIPKTPVTWMGSGNWDNFSQEWAKIASIAFGIFSCSGSKASGGELTFLLESGCSSSIYLFWKTSQETESSVLDSTNSSAYVHTCNFGVAENHDADVGTCASAMIDVGSKISETADKIIIQNQAVIPTKTK